MSDCFITFPFNFVDDSALRLVLNRSMRKELQCIIRLCAVCGWYYCFHILSSTLCICGGHWALVTFAVNKDGNLKRMKVFQTYFIHTKY